MDRFGQGRLARGPHCWSAECDGINVNPRACGQQCGDLDLLPHIYRARWAYCHACKVPRWRGLGRSPVLALAANGWRFLDWHLAYPAHRHRRDCLPARVIFCLDIFGTRVGAKMRPVCFTANVNEKLKTKNCKPM